MLVIVNTGNHAEAHLRLADIRRSNADSNHRIKAVILQRGNIHTAEQRIAVGMGMHAAHTAQTAGTASALNRRQLHTLIIAHRYGKHLTVARNVNAHLAVNKISNIRHTQSQLASQQLTALQTDIIKSF